MALSGSFSTVIDGYYRLRLDWSATQDVNNNTSTIYTSLYWESLSSSYHINASMSNTGYTGIAGTTYSFSATAGLSGGGSKLINSASKTVSHNADGTLTTAVSAYFPIKVTLSGTYYDSVSIDSQNITLDTIPRASQPTVSYTSQDMGYSNGLLVQTHRASSSFTHTLRYAFGNASGTITTGLATDYYWTVPLDLANQVPNSASGTGTIYCDTYSGSTFIGTKSVSFTVNVPATIVPTFSSITGAELNSTVSSIIGKYVQKLSNIRLTINGATGAYSSTISAYKINYNGSDYSSNSIDTGTITWNGSLTVTATITDSRGRTASKTLTLNVLAYDYPVVSGFTVSRCNSDGSTNEMGTYAKIITTGSASSLINSTEKNTLTYTLYSKARTAQTWTTIKAATTISGLSLNVTNVLGTYAATSSFDFRLDITDKFNTTVSLNTLATGQVTMSWGPTGIGIGKVWEQGALDLNGDLYKDGYRVMPDEVQTVSSLDTCYTIGKYLFTPSTTGCPNAGYGVVEVFVSSGISYNGSSNWIWQVAYTTESASTIYVRSRVNAGSWTNWYKVWNAGNDGSGSGLDADTLDTLHSGSFLRSDAACTASGLITLNAGAKGIGRVPGYSWNGTVLYNTNTYITHNLGYPPIVVFSGTTGNVNPNFVHQSANEIMVFNWNTGANDWSGTVYFY